MSGEPVSDQRPPFAIDNSSFSIHNSYFGVATMNATATPTEPTTALVGYVRRVEKPEAGWETITRETAAHDLDGNYHDVGRALFDLRSGAILQTPCARYAYFPPAGPVRCSGCGTFHASDEMLGKHCLVDDICGRYEVDPSWLIDSLGGYHCTDNYHDHSRPRTAGAPERKPDLFLTDGAEYLRRMASCHWLFDIIASTRKQIDRHDHFAVIVLTIHEDRSATYTACADIDDNGEFLDVYYRQQIEFTDFPLPGIKLYYALQEGTGVVMLPGEY